MTGKLFWMVVVGLTTAVLVLTAALAKTDPSMAYVHMATAASSAILLALLGIRDTRQTITNGGSMHAVAASKARAMAMVWTWATLCLVVTYATGILSWKEWWHFAIPFAAVSVLCLLLASTLARDAAHGTSDASMLQLSSYLNKAQLAGMVITMVGLLIDGKMTRFWKPVGQKIGAQDWGANNYFFFGALALAALSLHAISRDGQAQAERQD